MVLRQLRFFILGFLILSSTGARAIWPFDQRQVALVVRDGTAFPDELAVAQLMDVFVKKGRVRWVTQKSGPAQVVPFQVPRDFPWHSSPAVRQLGLKFKVDGLVVLAMRGVQLELQWYGTSEGLPLFFETLSLPEAGPRPGEAEQRKQRLVDWLNGIWAKIPGDGYVVKRDLTTISLEGVSQSNLKVGDKVDLYRIQKFDRHPLLKTLVSFTTSASGRAQIESIGTPFAIAKVEYESQVDSIQNGDRYTLAKVEAKPEKAEAPKDGEAAPENSAAARTFLPFLGVAEDSELAFYRIVDLRGDVFYGSLKHSEIVNGVADAYKLSSKSPGFRVSMQGYVTPQIILLSDLSFGFATFSNVDDAYGVTSLASGFTNFRLGGGYRNIFIRSASFPGEFIVSGAYRRFDFSMAASASDIAPIQKTYSGYELGVSLQIPILDKYAALFKGARMLGAALTEAPVTSGETSANAVWQFELGAKWKQSMTSEFVGSIVIESLASTMTGSGTRTTDGLSSTVSATLFALGYVAKF